MRVRNEFVSRKSILSKNDTNKESSNCSRSKILSPSSKSSFQLKFATDLISSIQEYCKQEPPNYVSFSNFSTPLYQAKNFKQDQRGVIVRENKKDLKTINVLLETLKIKKYHLNGSILCNKLSSDQSCYIRVSNDDWTTFQETQAIMVQNTSAKDCVEKESERYCFDFMLPVPKTDILLSDFSQRNRLKIKRGSIDSTESGISVGSYSTVTSQDSGQTKSKNQNLCSSTQMFQRHLIDQFGYCGPSQHFDICVVMRNKSRLFYDFNDEGGGYGIELVKQDGDSYQIYSSM